MEKKCLPPLISQKALCCSLQDMLKISKLISIYLYVKKTLSRNRWMFTASVRNGKKKSPKEAGWGWWVKDDVMTIHCPSDRVKNGVASGGLNGWKNKIIVHTMIVINF